MSSTPSVPQGPTPQRIMEMTWGFTAVHILNAALKIKLFDHLDTGPKLLEDLAAAAKASPRGVRAVANALVGLQMLAKDGEKYKLTPESAAFLVSTRPGYHGTLISHFASEIGETWAKLPETIVTGKPARSVNAEQGGAEFFREFVESLFIMNYAAAKALGADLAKTNKRPAKILDLAAGSGVWAIGVAEAIPGSSITAVDWPEVTPVTRRVAQRHGLGDRLKTIDGDLSTADFGTGHDIAVLGHILHSEGEAKSRKLLKKCFDALAPGGTIAIAEFVPNDDRTGPPMPLIFAVNMLVHTDVGDTFTFAQMTQWLTEAGFKQPRKLEIPGPSPLLLATKP